MKKEKIYAVEFIEYTNFSKTTVSDYDGVMQLKDIKYLEVGPESCLIRESDLPYFQKFGKGFRSIRLVGELIIPDLPTIQDYTVFTEPFDKQCDFTTTSASTLDNITTLNTEDLS